MPNSCYITGISDHEGLRSTPHHPTSDHLGNPRREPFPSGCLAVLATRTVEDVAIIAGVCLVLLTLELLCMLVIAIKG